MVESYWHTGLVVKNLEKSLDFYVGVLGMQVERIEDISGEFFSRLLGFPNLEGKNARLGVGPTHNIEMFQYINPVASPVAEDMQKPFNSPGTTWLGFMVDDIDAIYQKLTASGVKCLTPPNVRENPPPGRIRAVFFAQDPEGNWLEFAERPR